MVKELGQLMFRCDLVLIWSTVMLDSIIFINVYVQPYASKGSIVPKFVLLQEYVDNLIIDVNVLNRCQNLLDIRIFQFLCAMSFKIWPKSWYANEL